MLNTMHKPSGGARNRAFPDARDAVPSSMLGRVVRWFSAPAAMILFVSGCSTVRPEAFPGKIVRTRVVDRTERRTLRAELVPSGDGVVRVRLKDVRVRTIREVPVHEKILQYVSDEDATKRPVRVEVVPDEFIEGPETVRTETVEVGPLAQGTVELNGEPVRTDADGVYVDDAERILSLFDVPGRKRATLVFTAKGWGAATVEVRRDELLASLGVDSSLTGAAGSNDGLVRTASIPGYVVPGQVVDVRIEFRNGGKTPVWGLEGRIFSRHAWLDGRKFYFGKVGAGGVRWFRRRLRVPKDASPGTYYAVIGFWDWLGPIPEKRVPVRIVVEGPKP